MKILIIDDDSSYLELISEYLTQFGIEVMTCDSISKARAIVGIHYFDKCIVDVLLPEQNGIDFIREHSDLDTEFYILTGDLEHPDVISKLNSKSTIFSGIVIKHDLINGLKEIASGCYEKTS